MKSLTVVFPEKQKAELTERELEPLKPDQVLFKADKSLISTGTETICLNGVFDPGTNWHEWVKYPFLPGYAISGEVLETGSEVKSLKPGDRVYSERSHMQYVTESEDSLIKIPDEVSCEHSTWIALGRVAQNAVRAGNIQMGDTAAVIGAGQVGLLAMQFIRICGATRIIAIDPIEHRAKLALECGATDYFAGTAADAAKYICELTEGRMADIVCEATGHPAVLSPACVLARKNGKIILVGDTSVPSQQALGPGVVSNYLKIIGAHGAMSSDADNPFYPWTRKYVNQTTMTYIIQNRLNLDPLVSHRISPFQAPDFYMRLLKDRSFAVGVIIDWALIND